MAIYQLGDLVPVIPASCYIAPEATIIGSVTLGERVTIMSGAVVRGDNEPLVIGDDTNIQENCVLHTDPGLPLTLGKGVTVGHQVMLHGCTIGDGSLIGIKAVILNHATIGKSCLVGANTLITEGKQIPDRSLVLGSPGKVVRQLSDEEVSFLLWNAEHYVHNFKRYQRELQSQD
jgi:carbonic anhydrase/acetyltransferase-like protein (isoleucine patch superfamily)